MIQLKKISNKRCGSRFKVDVYLSYIENNTGRFEIHKLSKIGEEKVYKKWRYDPMTKGSDKYSMTGVPYPTKYYDFIKNKYRKYTPRKGRFQVKVKNQGTKFLFENKKYILSEPKEIHILVDTQDGIKLMRNKKLDTIFS